MLDKYKKNNPMLPVGINKYFRHKIKDTVYDNPITFFSYF